MLVDQPTDQYVVASSIKYIGVVTHMHIWRNSNQGGKRDKANFKQLYKCQWL